MCCNPSRCLQSLFRRRKFSSSFMRKSTRLSEILCSFSLVFSFFFFFSVSSAVLASFSRVCDARCSLSKGEKESVFSCAFSRLDTKKKRESRSSFTCRCFRLLFCCSSTNLMPSAWRWAKLKTKVDTAHFLFWQDLGARSGLDSEELIRTVKSLSLGKVFEQMESRFFGFADKRGKQGSSSRSRFWGSRHGADQRKRNLFVEKGFQAQDAAHQDQLHPGARDCRGERSGAQQLCFVFSCFWRLFLLLFRCEKLFSETESIRSTLQLCASWKRVARCRIRSCWQKFTRKSSFPWNWQTSKSRLNRSSIENTSPETTKLKRTIIWHKDKQKANFFRKSGF